MICYTSTMWVVKVKKDEGTNFPLEGWALVSKKGRVYIARIKLGTIKLDHTQAAPAIFVIGTDLQSDHWL